MFRKESDKMQNESKFDRKKSVFISLAIIFILSSLLTVFSLTFSSSFIKEDLFRSYFKSPSLLFMNFIPIFVLMVLVWLLSNRIWFSYTFMTVLIFIGGMANKTKLTYRDDPMMFSDITLVGEAGMMAQKYKLPLSPRIILVVISLLVVGFLVGKFLNFKIKSKKYRFISFFVFLLISILAFNKYYLREDTYNKIGDESLINRWLFTERHQAKGFVYPFIYSFNDLKDDELEGYNEKEAKEELAKYKYKDIEESKKVNIISIMLEAYNDFSIFEGVNIEDEVYKPFHDLQKKSVSGNIVTNIFAGGTIDTERAFLTGYNNHPKYRKNTNSFVRYLNEQGYRTEAMHPITGSFYNRRNVNDYLGFDNFDYLENKYEGLADEYLRDDKFFQFIIKGFEESKANNQPYFNFSVTYQNHGPYAKAKYHDKDYFERKPEYGEDKYNIFNNYLYGIKETGQAIEDLIEYFEKEDEPVVVVLFGDHNPWLGEGNSVYKMFGIDLDLGNEEGFRNYYQTPYIIWGNESAKRITGNDMVKTTDELGSSYLMAQLFEELGYEGNEYMQYIDDFRKDISVQNKEFFKEEGIYIKELSTSGLDLFKKYRNIEYYYARNFIKKD